MANPLRAEWFKGLRLVTPDGRTLKPKGSASAEGSGLPVSLPAGSFDSGRIDLLTLFPTLAREVGPYEIRWSDGQLRAPSRAIRVLLPYDETKRYVAEVETDRGSMLLELRPDLSPIAVKTFVEEYEVKHPRRLADVGVVADHFEHVIRLVGIDHVGLGSDFDGGFDHTQGVEGIPTAAELPVLADALRKRRYTEESIRGILGDNLRRFIQSLLPD